MAVHRARADLAGPASRLAGRLPRRAVEDGHAVQLVRRHVARLGRRRLPVAAGAAHAGDALQIRDMLLVVHLVEDRLVVVRHVHPDQEQRAHRYVPLASITRAPAFWLGPMNSTMLPSGSFTKTWRRPVGPEKTSRQTRPRASIFAAVASQSSVHSAKWG